MDSVPLWMNTVFTEIKQSPPVPQSQIQNLTFKLRNALIAIVGHLLVATVG